MAALLLVLLALAAPLTSAGEERCLPTVEGAGVVEGVAGSSHTEPPGEGPCDSECPPDGGCCAVCCKTALRASASGATAEAAPAVGVAPAPSFLVAADPGCSVWHPPRG